MRMMLGAHSRLHAAHELHLTGLEVYFKTHEAVPDRTREDAAARVLQYMQAMEEAHARLGGHILRYEDLTTDPAAELHALGGGFGDWNDKIRSGRVQPDRAVPAEGEIAEVLRPMCRAWGYL